MAIAFCRTVVLYLLIVVGVRLMGKRQVGELEPTELVLAMILSDLAAVPMQDFGIPLLFGVVPIITLLCLTMILSVLTMRSTRLRALLCGKPSIVVQDGVLQQREMKRTRITIDELLEEMRLQGVTDLASVKYAILETSGKLSILLDPAQKPPTCRELSVAPTEYSLPIILISDGRLLEKHLKSYGKDLPWLMKQIRQRGADSIREVFLFTVDQQGQIYFLMKGCAS